MKRRNIRDGTDPRKRLDLITNLFSILFSAGLFLLTATGSASATTNTQVFFSPNGGCQQAVVAQISKATKTIDIAMYYFTARETAQALIKAKDRNVKIRVVLDKSQEGGSYAKSRFLIKNGINAKIHTGSGLMHNKFAVIDGGTLITGSFNWTATAEDKNEENLLIITDPTLIAKYQERFEYLWKGSREVKVKDEKNGGENVKESDN